MSFPAFLDTNVLFGATLNDTLLRIAELDAFRPLWSSGVLTELHDALVREAAVTAEQAAQRIALMREAFRDAEVVDYEGLIEGMQCDPKDRHVLAAAVRGGAQVLVTFNVRDFPTASVDSHDIAVLTPDAFLLDQLDLYPAIVGRALVDQMREARRPPLTIGQLLGRLARAGVPAFAEEARRHEFA